MQANVIIETPPRTVCACRDCVQCCKDQPGSLAPGDFERIRDHLQLDDAAAREKFRSSEGALVYLKATGLQRRIRTIVPLFDRHRKRCTFLDDHDRCTVHAVAPAGCAYFDTHLDMPAAQSRSYWLVTQQIDADYQQLRQTLKVSEHYRPKAY